MAFQSSLRLLKNATSRVVVLLNRLNPVTYLLLGVDLVSDLDVPLGVSPNQNLDAISDLVNRRNRYSSPEMVGQTIFGPVICVISGCTKKIESSKFDESSIRALILYM